MTLTWAEFEALRAPKPRANTAEAKLRALEPGLPTLWSVYNTHKTATDPGRRAARIAERIGIHGVLFAVRERPDGKFELWVGLVPKAEAIEPGARDVTDRMTEEPPPERVIDLDLDADQPERVAVSEFDAVDSDDDAADVVPLATTARGDLTVGGLPARNTGGSPQSGPLGRNQPSRGGIAATRRAPLREPMLEGDGEPCTISSCTGHYRAYGTGQLICDTCHTRAEL